MDLLVFNVIDLNPHHPDNAKYVKQLQWDIETIKSKKETEELVRIIKRQNSIVWGIVLCGAMAIPTAIYLANKGLQNQADEFHTKIDQLNILQEHEERQQQLNDFILQNIKKEPSTMPDSF